ncbi:MAG: hypothetical protein QM638_22140, partial [Nocardioides sp.]
MAEVAFGALPEPVRERIVALVAEVLPEVVALPASLRRVASFAPVRRAKVGASAIAAALTGPGGDELRDQVARVLHDRHPADAVGPAATASAGDGAPAPMAAEAWLRRAEGWDVVLADAVARLAMSEANAADVELERLRARLAAAEDELRDVRADRRQRIEELKAENATLRRRLGEARAGLREAGATRDDALGEAKAAQRRAEDVAAERDRSLRQLRMQLERVEAELGSQRRAARAEREDASLRARFLLDTLLDAASGLRRELALPPAERAPGERLETELAGAAGGT